MTWTRAATLALILAALLPSAARADDASRLKLARDVVETAHAADNMRALMPTFMAQMRQIIVQGGNGDTKQVDTYVERFQKRFTDGVPSFVELVAAVYAREFSEEDLGNLLIFYRSPTGQHLLGKQTVIAQGMIATGQKWGQSIAQQVLDEMQADRAKTATPKKL